MENEKFHDKICPVEKKNFKHENKPDKGKG